MTQHLSEGDVRAIAAYTRIGVTEDDIGQLTLDLNTIIDTLNPILACDLEGVEPTYHPIGNVVNVLREDEEEPSFTQTEALANSESTQEGSFLIPAILGGGEGK